MITPASRRTWGSDISESSIFSLDQLLRKSHEATSKEKKPTAETTLVYKLLTSFSTEDASETTASGMVINTHLFK